MKKTIINLTPHEVVLLDKKSKKILATIPTSGIIARLPQETVSCGEFEFDGIKIPLTKTNYKWKEANIPEKIDGTIFIVSQLVKNASNREDLVVPAEMVRDEKNNILGCCSLGL
jgi:hypothetical protein